MLAGLGILRGDHPRVGGEKGLLPQFERPPPGSPPRGRGKVWSGAGPRPHLGITPAWAGKRRHTRWVTEMGGDHPRVGGEKRVRLTCVSGTWGSPPRGRGKGTANACRNWLMGITPAWAGKSLTVPCFRCCFWDHPRVGGEKRSNWQRSAAIRGSPPRGRGKD